VSWDKHIRPFDTSDAQLPPWGLTHDDILAERITGLTEYAEGDDHFDEEDIFALHNHPSNDDDDDSFAFDDVDMDDIDTATIDTLDLVYSFRTAVDGEDSSRAEYLLDLENL
jgi:hypothetical protein